LGLELEAEKSFLLFIRPAKWFQFFIPGTGIHLIEEL
jgi:hypothetical protein